MASPAPVRWAASFCLGVNLADSLLSILPQCVLFPQEHTGCFDKCREAEPDVPFGGETQLRAMSPFQGGVKAERHRRLMGVRGAWLEPLTARVPLPFNASPSAQDTSAFP